MNVDEISNVVLLFSNPAWKGTGTVPNTLIRNVTDSSLGYSSVVAGNVTVLASRYASTTNGDIQGLLYIPDLPAGSDCLSDVSEYVSSRAVRKADLPPTNFNLIAIAPWVTPECTRAFLASARTDPLRAFIFYRPSNSIHKPPPPSSSVWNLNDEGRWKTQNKFPILAVSGAYGQELMDQLGLYSGDLSEVPNGTDISAVYNADIEDYVRIWTRITVSEPSNLPNIWVFFLIIIGVFLAVIGGTSLLMHFAQRRRRIWLRRRVEQGEINLEGMGIKRLTVPPAEIDKFPLFTYDYKPPDLESLPTSPTSPRSTRTRSSRPRGTSMLDSPLPISVNGLDSPFASSHLATNHQPTCAICLEPYENRATIIRELPCGHIFHPDCIDEFLSECSSLCPLCKACMLPRGYCPPITNAMVRRERAIHKLRDRIEVDDVDDDDSPKGRMHSWRSNVMKNWLPAKNNDMQSRAGTIELRSAAAALADAARADHERTPSPGTDSGIRARARRRMRELAGTEMDDDEHGLPRWQRIRHRIFPGF